MVPGSFICYPEPLLWCPEASFWCPGSINMVSRKFNYRLSKKWANIGG